MGTNGIGKSTALKILSGKLKPNLGQFKDEPSWQDILVHFRGSELQKFFTKVMEDQIKTLIKPQYVDVIPQQVKGTVRPLLEKRDERGLYDTIVADLDLGHVLERTVPQLSGGELQRFAIAAVCLQKADVYMMDEPSSYLDVVQRLKAARVIRSLCASDK